MKIEAQNEVINGLSKIRFKIWDRKNRQYLHSRKGYDWEWWTAKRAHEYLKREKLKGCDIHQIETIFIEKTPVIVKLKNI